MLGAFLSPRELASSRGKLAAVQGLVEDYWSKFTDEDLKLMSGRRSRLIEKLQERYGFSHQEAEIQVRSFQKTLPQERQGATLKQDRGFCLLQESLQLQLARTG